ncbi:MAG: DUF1905 domain-containing protein [Bacteroidota bacterium]
MKYEFSGKLWTSAGPGGWHFVSLPQDLSKEIRANMQWQEEGWGRMKATAVIGESEWDTAIWFDKKAGTYLLPVKSAIRKKTGVKTGDVIKVSVLV